MEGESWGEIRPHGDFMSCCMIQEDPPPCSSGMVGIQEDPNVIITILYSHYYWVGGHLMYDINFPTNLNSEGVQTRKLVDCFGKFWNWKLSRHKNDGIMVS